MSLRQATQAEIKAALNAQYKLGTFRMLERTVLEEYAVRKGQQPVRIEATITVSSEYDDEGYFDAHTLERFEVFDAEHNCVPLLDLETGEEATLDDLIDGPLSGYEADILEFFETGNCACVINLLEPPLPPVTLWLEVSDDAQEPA